MHFYFLLAGTLSGGPLLLRAVMLAPDNAAAHFKLGVVYVVQTQAAQARHEFETTLRLDPDGEWAAQAEKQLKQLQP